MRNEQQPSTTPGHDFTPAEIAAFEHYCVMLCGREERRASGEDYFVVSRAHPCTCDRRIPAGIPASLRRTAEDICPSCVFARGGR